MARDSKSGAYAKLLANYARDDAIIEAGERAELLFVRALAFCADSDSDGFITDKQMDRVVGVGLRGVPNRAQTLVEVGLFVREDGGYLVRSWTKLHETAVQRGRRLKADRERKAKKTGPSATNSGRNLNGFQPELAPETADVPSDSLSMTEQYSSVQDRSEQDTAEQVDSSLGENRYVTLGPPNATEPPQVSDTTTNPTDARCSAHRGVADPGPCRGCMQARERAEQLLERSSEQTQRDLERRARECTACDGVHIIDGEGRPTRRRCVHPTSARVAS